MFGFSIFFVELKRVANLEPNIVFVLAKRPEKTNSLSDLIIPQQLCGEWLRTLYLAIIL